MGILPKFKIADCDCGCGGKDVECRKVGKLHYCMNSYRAMKQQTNLQKWYPNFSFSIEDIKAVIDEVLYVEEWVWVKDYDNEYQVSSFGRLKTYNWRGTGKVKIITPKVNNLGYLGYRLSAGKTYKFYSAQQIVAIHFLDNPNNLPEVNHEDLDKSNNHFTNLEWCTRKQNMEHASKSGILKGRILGEKNGRVTLTTKQVIDIKSGKHGFNRTQISKTLNCSWDIINRILIGKTWTHIVVPNFIATIVKKRKTA